MRRFIVLLALLSIIPSASALDQQKILSAMQTVVMVRGYNDTGGLSYGSGVVVDDNKVLTNCHIFRSTKEPWVAHGEDSYNIVSVQADRWHDLCLLTTLGLPFKPAQFAKVSDLKRGQEVLSMGHSNGADMFVA